MTEKTEIAVSEKAYLESGQEVFVIAKTNGGFLVEIVYEEYDEPYFENTRLVRRVFKKPPTAIFKKQVARLQDEIQTLETQKRELLSDIRQSEKDHAEKLKRYSQFGGLECLDLFLDKKITHYVMPEYGRIEIIDIKDTKCNGWDKKQKLVTLFGDTDGNLQWRLNKYSDGSGSSVSVYPVIGHEAAIEKAKELVLESCREAIAAERFGRDLRPLAEQFSVTLPQEWVAGYVAEQKKYLIKSITETHERERDLKSTLMALDPVVEVSPP